MQPNREREAMIDSPEDICTKLEIQSARPLRVTILERWLRDIANEVRVQHIKALDNVDSTDGLEFADAYKAIENHKVTW